MVMHEIMKSLLVCLRQKLYRTVTVPKLLNPTHQSWKVSIDQTFAVLP
jgi:hypothetical protein